MGFETANILNTNRGQIVLIPGHMEVKAGRACLRKAGNSLVVSFYHPSWQNLFDSLKLFTSDFMDDRGQPKNQQRRIGIAGVNMHTQEFVENKLRELKPLLAQKYHVSRIGYFGSFSRKEQNKKSDIDILVEFSRPVGWDFFDLKDLLEKELHARVDLVSVGALREQLRETILKQIRYV